MALSTSKAALFAAALLAATPQLPVKYAGSTVKPVTAIQKVISEENKTIRKCDIAFIGLPPGLFAGGVSAVINSVQHFSIALNGVTSNTATISAVTTANSFIVYGGISHNDGKDDPNRYITGLVLTNTTTVTASKNTSTNNVTIVGCVVEFKSGVLKTNQSGTIAITSASSNTATISAITIANSAVVYQGATYTSSAAAAEAINVRLAVTNTTTITAQRNGTGAPTTTAYYTAIEFNSGKLNSSTQEIHPQMTTTNTSANVTITGVTTGATMLIWGGFDRTGTTNGREGVAPIVALTSTTNVAISRFDALSNTVTATCTVLEFKTANIKTMNRGTNAIAGSGTTVSATISAVTTSKTILNYCGHTYQKGTSNTVTAATFGNVYLASTTAITSDRQTSAAEGVNVGYEAIEHN